MLCWSPNPNRQKSYKILQRLSPKHTAHGVAQSPYPIYSHGKAYLSKQLPWHAAGDPCLAHSKSRVQALGPTGALRMFFSTLPSFLFGEIVFLHLPHHLRESVRDIVHHSLGLTNPNRQNSYKILQRLSPRHAARGVAQSPYPIYSHGKAYLSKQLRWHAPGDPWYVPGLSRGPRGHAARNFFCTLPSFLLGEIVFLAPSLPSLWKCSGWLCILGNNMAQI